jgi:hypothetical protein
MLCLGGTTYLVSLVLIVGLTIVLAEHYGLWRWSLRWWLCVLVAGFLHIFGLVFVWLWLVLWGHDHPG